MLQLKKEFRKLDTWLIVNRMSLNIAKTKFLVFHPYNKPIKQRITLQIHKTAIPESEYIKYLGIMVDSALFCECYARNLTFLRRVFSNFSFQKCSQIWKR